jgi:hypothetical protein
VHYLQIRTPDIDIQGLTPATQALGRSLASCILGDEKLQSEVVPLLRDQDRVTTNERSAGLESVILKALRSDTCVSAECWPLEWLPVGTLPFDSAVTPGKLLGPAKWTYFYLYVILDVFSRYASGNSLVVGK